jgi:hypothetical protein
MLSRSISRSSPTGAGGGDATAPMALPAAGAPALRRAVNQRTRRGS